MQLKFNFAFHANRGGIFLQGAGDVVRLPRSRLVFGVREPCETEL